MTREEEVIEKARTWRRAQKARQAAPQAEWVSAKSAECNALRKLGNAVDSLEKKREGAPQQLHSTAPAVPQFDLPQTGD
jgi:hypothetical protein